MNVSTTYSLLKQLVRRELALRYRSTLFGVVWSFSKPVMLVLLFYVVFEHILPVRGGMSGIPPEMNYGLFLATGIITWTFLSGALMQGTNSYLLNQHLISRAKFWRPVLPMAETLSHWVHYLFSQIVLLALLIWMGDGVSFPALVEILLLSLFELVFALLLVWILAAMQLIARDTFQLLEIGVMVWFYVSPVLYPAQMGMSLFEKLERPLFYWLNPAVCIMALRHHILLGMDCGLSSPGDWALVALWLMILFSGLGFVAWKLNRKVDREMVDRF